MNSCVLGVTLVAVAAGGGVEPPDQPVVNRVSLLVMQLGHDEYEQREAASQELVEIGEAALAPLRQAAAFDSDPEIRWRAEQSIQVIATRIRAAVTEKELEKLQGTWYLLSTEVNGQQTQGEDKNYLFIFKGDKWSLHVNGQLSQAGIVAQIEVNAKYNAIDLPIMEGGYAGATVKSIYAIEGNTLKYLYQNAEPGATEFSTKPGDGRGYSIFRRAKP